MAAQEPQFDDNKYHKKRGGAQNVRAFYLVAAGFALMVFMYMMAPGSQLESAGADARLNGAPMSTVTAEQDYEPKTSTSVTTSITPEEEQREQAAKASQEMEEYPRYEGGFSSSDEMVSASDEPSPREEDDAESDDAENGSSSRTSEETTGDPYDEKEEGHLFEDQEAFDNAPIIQVLPESKTRKYSKIVLAHERYHRDHPARLYIPRLRKDTDITAEKFRKLFMERSQPVIIPFDALRHLNFTSKGYTLEELRKIYPNSKPKLYKYGSIIADDLDLGPALTELMNDNKLRKTKTGKSYPRNTKINLSALSRINMQRPPIIPDIPMMLPSFWFGPTSADTPLHSDCCDNWAMMVAGTKRWVIAPPSDARILKPTCQGGLCWVKRLALPDASLTATQSKIKEGTQFIKIDLTAGEILYLPAGWFHNIRNVDGTIMINFWSKNGPEFLEYYEKLT
ncbi:Bifunctional arginine demethylase and lysyl-hydroxylase psr-1 [Hondaea fermentalgiana]|uniref:Bifunctional arginine demethylase and lysyl-hydroxylase psr-1 n=1 Tax=Hondaea fermentalgiana TaxID=2315210 RepID=A0A2R5GAH7_9STRA|nr:Bifunctional arginine demethylase and lysyl-hydroxylase psr-1 [Hondaea fermentalgiana]|eukprot:GBG28017.1 Bifunctional arginine demethylase and lysyl-hydroxylase psr-1 [Hondaea fermentalgiana]